MANWRSFGDRMLYCHRNMLKTWCNCSNPASFHNSSTSGGGGLLLGGGCLKKTATFLPIRRCFSSSSPPVSPPRLLSSSPLLMVPPRVVVANHNNSSHEDNESDDYYNFFSLLEQSQFRVRKNLRIPWQRELLTPKDAACVGSSHGWLVFNDPRNCHSYLYNPLIDSPHIPYIPLPSVETIPYFRGLRFFKSDLSSPSPSINTQFLIKLHVNDNRNADTFEQTLSYNRARYWFVRRLVMSSAPSVPSYSSSSSSTTKPKPEQHEDCTIMALHCGADDVGFCKPGDDRWTMLDGVHRPYMDIIYFSKDQRFYALHCDCINMEAWDLRDPSCPKHQVFDSPDDCPGKFREKIGKSYNWDVKDYLVESSGDLLLVSRFVALSVAENEIVHPRRLEAEKGGGAVKNEMNIDEEWEKCFLHDDDAYWTVGFDVRKFDMDHNKWETVECLGDRALFVGDSHSFSLSTRDYPELIGNSIYFADDFYCAFNDTYHGHDNGIFHLGDNTIKPYYPNRVKIIDPHPVWVAPNPTQCS